uniref:Serine/threonine-protein phosphatase 7 long form homolog n=1 Tax=Nicotiana sylvestris TaxID=4096 RepID=A0A1U7W0H0_NICSY|nr:PREDICTED: serine/threonine-protein phosphatase 7 long form homolog [Nicotiana sylvestris]
MDVPHVHLGPFSDEILVLQGDHRSAYVWEGELVEQTLRARRLDWSLIKTLIDRWRSETHTFHLPISEATITLQDVQVLYGLPTDGLAVALPQYMRSMMRAQYLDLLQQFTGFRPQGEAAPSGAVAFL